MKRYRIADAENNPIKHTDMNLRIMTTAALCVLMLGACGNRNATTDDAQGKPAAATATNGKGLDTDSRYDAIVSERYHGLLPAADGPGIDYDLVLIRQESSDHGIYSLMMTYLEAENGNDVSFIETGDFAASTKDGIKYFTFTPDSGSAAETFYIMEPAGDLTLVGKDLKRAASQLNYTLHRLK